jgi:hypothetical protein
MDILGFGCKFGTCVSYIPLWYLLPGVTIYSSLLLNTSRVMLFARDENDSTSWAPIIPTSMLNEYQGLNLDWNDSGAL